MLAVDLESKGVKVPLFVKAVVAFPRMLVVHLDQEAALMALRDVQVEPEERLVPAALSRQPSGEA